MMRRILALCLFMLLGPALLCAQAPDLDGLPSIGASVGGRIAPDGKTEIQIDLPGNLQKRNIGSPPPNGPGCCVFRSLSNAALWQNIPALYDMPEWMVKKGIAGGGYPQKAAALIKQIAAERGLPEPDYVQAEGSDLELMKLATATGRAVCSTYSHSPTGRYQGHRVQHMVNVLHCDDAWVAVCDNNYLPSPAALASNDVDNVEWMTPAEFAPVYTGGRSGWMIVLLECGPPNPPRN